MSRVGPNISVKRTAFRGRLPRALDLMNETRNIIERTFAGHLRPGKSYRVAKPFLDAAKSVHPVGEAWTYLGYSPNGFAEATYISVANQGQRHVGFAIPWDDSADSVVNNMRLYFCEASAQT